MPSPPIFPRRRNSVYYQTDNEKESPSLVSTTFSQISDCLSSAANTNTKRYDLRDSSNDLTEDPFSVQIMDELCKSPSSLS